MCCKNEGLGKLSEVYPVKAWKVRLFYFNDFIKTISKSYKFKIILAINGFVWIDGDCETKKAIIDQINSY